MSDWDAAPHPADDPGPRPAGRVPPHNLDAEASLLGAIAYFILPFDFMPDVLPILGFTDDAAVLATAIRLVATHILPEHREAARAALKRGVEPVDLSE